MYLNEKDEHVDLFLWLGVQIKTSFFENLPNLQWLLSKRCEWKEVLDKDLETEHFLIRLKSHLRKLEECIYY